MKRKKYRLLIIDDSLKSRMEVYSKFFDSEQFEIQGVESYNDFFRVKNQSFDAIILDVFLECNDWNYNNVFGVREDIKARFNSVPIFIISNRWGDSEILAEMTVLTNLFGKNIADYLSFLEIKNSVSLQPGITTVINDQLQSRFIDKLRVVRQEAVGIDKEDEEDISLLLLSDIQFKDPHTVKASSGLLGTIISSLENKSIYPDFIVITGDVSYSGCPSEYMLALQELEKFMARLWPHMPEHIRKQRVVLIPGNHDVNLRLTISSNIKFSPNDKAIVVEGSISTDENTHKIRCTNIKNNYGRYGLLPFREFAFKLTDDRRWIDSEDLNWVDQRFEHLGLTFVNVNTVNKLNASSPKHASIDIDKFSYLGANYGSFNIMLSHHGLNSSELDEDSKKSVTGNMLKTLNVHLWLWGHKHSYEMEEVYSPTRGDEYANLFSIQVPSTHQLATDEDKKRGYVILDLKREKGKVTSAHSRYFRTEPDKPPFIAKDEHLNWG